MTIEVVSGTQTWKQSFDYNWFDTRTFGIANGIANNNMTTIPTDCSTAVCNPALI